MPIESKVVLGLSRSSEGGARGTGCLAGAKGSIEALFHEPGGRAGEAREVQKEVGSFWGKVSDSHLQLHQERREGW